MLRWIVLFLVLLLVPTPALSQQRCELGGTNSLANTCTDDTILVGSGTTYAESALTTCTSAQKIQYTTGTNAFTCVTDNDAGTTCASGELLNGAGTCEDSLLDGGTATGPIAVDGSTDAVQLIVKANATQSSFPIIAEFRNSSSTRLWGFEADGGFANNVHDGNGIPMASTYPTECLMLDAAGGVCDTTGGCTSATVEGTNFDYRTMDFATGADSTASWAFELPDNFVGTTAQVYFHWVSNNAACNGGVDDDVCWSLDSASIANDGTWHTAGLSGTADGVTDRCLANGDLMKTGALTFTHSMTAGQRAMVVVTRDTDGALCAGTADDDYAQDASLLAVRFCYTVDNVFSGE